MTARRSYGTMIAENGWVLDFWSATPLNHWHSVCFRSRARLLECAELALDYPAIGTRLEIAANSGIQRCRRYPALVYYGCWSLALGDFGFCCWRSRRLDSPNSKSQEASRIMYSNSSIQALKHRPWNLPWSTGTHALHWTYTSFQTASSPAYLFLQAASEYLSAHHSPPTITTYWHESSPAPSTQHYTGLSSAHSAIGHWFSISKCQPPIDLVGQLSSIDLIDLQSLMFMVGLLPLADCKHLWSRWCTIFVAATAVGVLLVGNSFLLDLIQLSILNL